MEAAEVLAAVFGVAAREAALLAGSGFLILGLSDLLIDLIWLGLMAKRRLGLGPAEQFANADLLDRPRRAGLLAIFLPAWDEAAVIADMLRHALATFDHPHCRIYVGCYPNDPATIDVVRSITDPRIRLVITDRPGPTTKANCLNHLWSALLEDEAAEGMRAKAVVMHDAEDVVHSAELRLFDSLIERFDLVQLPVLPLVDSGSRWVAGHYADEFAESHGKELVVRQALGAALPSAGVGCAFSRERLAELAEGRAGPFDADCLTEDYELGLRLRIIGGKGAFVRLRGGEGRPLVVTREYFPSSIEAAVSQKARWITGIALSGWDRLGWGGGIAERWMRLRDRQSVLAAILLVTGYLALLFFAIGGALWLLTGAPPPELPPRLQLLLEFNAFLLAWRMVMRFGFVRLAYGWREGVRSIPRMLVSNFIAMLAAQRAVLGYLRIRRTGETKWDKTAHQFPAAVPAE